MSRLVRLLNESLAVLVVIVAIIGAVAFVKKFEHQPAPLDEIKMALGSLRDAIPAGRIIGCMSYTRKAETANEVAHALIPVQVAPYAKRDTILFVFNSDVSDSERIATTQGRLLLWKVRSAHYRFELNCERK